MAKGQKRLLGVGLGAGLLGAFFVALKYAVRPATKTRVPDTISPAIFRTKVLHTSMGEMVYHESGSGPTLVFVHGICPGASSYEWSKIYPGFTGNHRVLAPDLIGFGESARPAANRSAGDYARALAEFLRATCDEPPTLVASGLGGGLSVLLASQHPELVGRLILVMPTGLTELATPQLSMTTRLTSAIPILHRFLYRNYESTRVAITAWLEIYGFFDRTKITAEMIDVYTTCAQQYGAEHAIRNLHSGRFNFDLEARLKTLAQPLTLIWSDSVPSSPPEIATRLRELASGSRLVFVHSAGQLAALEAPDEVAALIGEEIEPGPRVFKP